MPNMYNTNSIIPAYYLNLIFIFYSIIFFVAPFIIIIIIPPAGIITTYIRALHLLHKKQIQNVTILDTDKPFLVD